MISEVKNELGNSFIVIEKENGSTTWIPMIESNSDYQAYLASLDEQQAAQQLGGNPIGDNPLV